MQCSVVDKKGCVTVSVCWQKSCRQSMDMYSSLQSPSLSIFSPGIHHRLSSSHLSSSYQRTPQDEHTTGSQPLKIPFLPAKGGHYLPVTDQVRKSEEEVRKAEVLEAELVADSRKSSFVQGLFNGGLLVKPTMLRFNFFPNLKLD